MQGQSTRSTLCLKYEPSRMSTLVHFLPLMLIKTEPSMDTQQTRINE